MAYGKFVHSPSDIPEGEHWAIIKGESVWIPGDERSRTNPGHGYPEHTEKYISYEYFTNEEEFKAELARRLESRFDNNVRGIHVAGSYKATTTISFSENSK